MIYTQNDTTDISYAKKLIKEDYHNLYMLPNLRDNDEVVLYAIGIDAYSLTFASDRLRSCADIIEYAVLKSAYSITFAADILKQDKTFIRRMCKLNSLVASVLVSMGNMLDDREFVKDIVRDNFMTYIFIADIVAQDEDFLMELIKLDIRIVSSTPKKYLTKNIFLQILPIDGSMLLYGDDEITTDKELVMLAISTTPRIFRCLGEDMRSDIEVVHAVFRSKFYYLLRYASAQFKTETFIKSLAETSNMSWRVLYHIINSD